MFLPSSCHLRAHLTSMCIDGCTSTSTSSCRRAALDEQHVCPPAQASAHRAVCGTHESKHMHDTHRQLDATNMPTTYAHVNICCVHTQYASSAHQLCAIVCVCSCAFVGACSGKGRLAAGQVAGHLLHLEHLLTAACRPSQGRAWASGAGGQGDQAGSQGDHGRWWVWLVGCCPFGFYWLQPPCLDIDLAAGSLHTAVCSLHLWLQCSELLTKS